MRQGCHGNEGGQALEVDVVRIDYIDSIRIVSWLTAVRGAVYVNVIQEDIFRPHDDHRSHLALNHAESF